MNGIAVKAHKILLSSKCFFCLLCCLCWCMQLHHEKNYVQSLLLFHYEKMHSIPLPSYISYNEWESVDEVEGESGGIRLCESFEEEDNCLHREPSSSGDRLGNCLIVLDCRGGREDVAIHLHLSPPLLSSTPQPSLLSSVSPHPIKFSPTFSTFLHLSTP